MSHRLHLYTVGEKVDVMRMGGVSLHKAVVLTIDEETKQPTVFKMESTGKEVTGVNISLYRPAGVSRQFSDILH